MIYLGYTEKIYWSFIDWIILLEPILLNSTRNNTSDFTSAIVLFTCKKTLVLFLVEFLRIASWLTDWQSSPGEKEKRTIFLQLIVMDKRSRLWTLDLSQISCSNMKYELATSNISILLFRSAMFQNSICVLEEISIIGKPLVEFFRRISQHHLLQLDC